MHYLLLHCTLLAVSGHQILLYHNSPRAETRQAQKAQPDITLLFTQPSSYYSLDCDACNFACRPCCATLRSKAVALVQCGSVAVATLDSHCCTLGKGANSSAYVGPCTAPELSYTANVPGNASHYGADEDQGTHLKRKAIYKASSAFDFSHMAEMQQRLLCHNTFACLAQLGSEHQGYT